MPEILPPEAPKKLAKNNIVTIAIIRHKDIEKTFTLDRAIIDMQKTTAKLGSVCSVTWKFLCVADEIKDEHSLKKNVQAPAKMDSINIIEIVFKAE